jgi:hypothetical protein
MSRPSHVNTIIGLALALFCTGLLVASGLMHRDKPSAGAGSSVPVLRGFASDEQRAELVGTAETLLLEAGIEVPSDGAPAVVRDKLRAERWWIVYRLENGSMSVAIDGGKLGTVSVNGKTIRE